MLLAVLLKRPPLLDLASCNNYSIKLLRAFPGATLPQTPWDTLFLAQARFRNGQRTAKLGGKELNTTASKRCLQASCRNGKNHTQCCKGIPTLTFWCEKEKVWASQSPRASSGVQWKLFHLSQFNFAPWKVTTTQLPQIAEGWETPAMKDTHRERKGLFFHPCANAFSIFQHNPQLSSKEFLYLSFNRVFHSYQKPSFLHIAVIKRWHYKTWSI